MFDLKQIFSYGNCLLGVYYLTYEVPLNFKMVFILYITDRILLLSLFTMRNIPV